MLINLLFGRQIQRGKLQTLFYQCNYVEFILLFKLLDCVYCSLNSINRRLNEF